MSGTLLMLNGEPWTYCRWPCCHRRVLAHYWGCRQHWLRLPQHMRDDIMRYQQPGPHRGSVHPYRIAISRTYAWSALVYRQDLPYEQLQGDYRRHMPLELGGWQNAGPPPGVTPVCATLCGCYRPARYHSPDVPRPDPPA